jgi:DNA-binding IscR family transcriptional regulator
MVRSMMRNVRDAASDILDQMTLADAAEAGRARDAALKRRKIVISKAA